MEKCKWTKTDDDYAIYDTECGDTFFFNEGGIKDNNFNYCPYCGREIESEGE